MKRKTGFEPVTSRFAVEKLFAVSILNLVLHRGIEPRLPDYKTGVLPLY